MIIDLYAKMPGCDFHTWDELLTCPQWGVSVFPVEDAHYINLIRYAQRQEEVRAILGGHPLKYTNAYRPELYNYLIGGAPRSAHKDGKAGDWVHAIFTPDQCRDKLEPYLDQLGLRMENLPGSSWVHTDIKEPGAGGRFFKP